MSSKHSLKQDISLEIEEDRASFEELEHVSVGRDLPDLDASVAGPQEGTLNYATKAKWNYNGQGSTWAPEVSPRTGTSVFRDW